MILRKYAIAIIYNSSKYCYTHGRLSLNTVHLHSITTYRRVINLMADIWVYISIGFKIEIVIRLKIKCCNEGGKDGAITYEG